MTCPDCAMHQERERFVQSELENMAQGIARLRNQLEGVLEMNEGLIREASRQDLTIRAQAETIAMLQDVLLESSR